MAYNFAKKPFWLFSHVFVAAAVVLFVVLALWQLDRLGQRQDQNAAQLSQLDSEPFDITSLSTAQLTAFKPVSGQLEVVDADFVRILSRTQQAATGQHVVALAIDNNDVYYFINRGFIQTDETFVEQLASEIEVDGYLRESFDRGRFGVADTGDEDFAPRLDVEALTGRLESSEVEVAPLWIQQRNDDPVAAIVPTELPEISEGSHLSYALQWFGFALLTAVAYVLILRRRAGETA